MEEGEAAQEQKLETTGGELQMITSELHGLVGELMEMTKGMWTEEIVGQAGLYKQAVPDLKDDFQTLLNDLLEAAAGTGELSPEQQREAVAAFRNDLATLKGEVPEVARARRQEEVEATKYVLEAMVAGDICLDPTYRSNLAQLSTGLPRPERETLYEENRRNDALSAAAMILVPILGLGSWKQRDGLGAVTTKPVDSGQCRHSLRELWLLRASFCHTHGRLQARLRFGILSQLRYWVWR